jgi:hypothetical protein
MIRSRSSPRVNPLRCASWLVYATRGSTEDARRARRLIISIKVDEIDIERRKPVVELVVQQAARRLGRQARSTFDGDPFLVPVPRSGLARSHSVWPAQRVCEELIRQGLAADVLPLLKRTTAIPKSAGSRDRPPLGDHLSSMVVQKSLKVPGRLLLVDDVVTSGTTMMACAQKLARAFPGVPIGAFALARVQSQGEPTKVFDPLVEFIVPSGARCARVSEP